MLKDLSLRKDCVSSCLLLIPRGSSTVLIYASISLRVLCIRLSIISFLSLVKINSLLKYLSLRKDCVFSYLLLISRRSSKVLIYALISLRVLCIRLSITSFLSLVKINSLSNTTSRVVITLAMVRTYTRKMFVDQYLIRYLIYALGLSRCSLLLPRFILSVIANALHLYACR